MNFRKLFIIAFVLISPLFSHAHQFKRSALANMLLRGLKGIEIGGSAHNAFGLDTLNVDYTDDYTTQFKLDEIKLCGHCMKVDIIALGDQLPLADNSVDFVISSHVIEHFYDPVKAIKEWLRVVKPGGIVYTIAPHKERTFDKPRPRTPLSEIIQRHDYPTPPEVDNHGHYSVWITKDFLDISKYYQWPIVCYQDVDDKVGNGFTIVLMKSKDTSKETDRALTQLRKRVGKLASTKL